MTKIFYICDRKACDVCHPEYCCHTEKIEHAKHFDKVVGKTNTLYFEDGTEEERVIQCE